MADEDTLRRAYEQGYKAGRRRERLELLRQMGDDGVIGDDEPFIDYCVECGEAFISCASSWGRCPDCRMDDTDGGR